MQFFEENILNFFDKIKMFIFNDDFAKWLFEKLRNSLRDSGRIQFVVLGVWQSSHNSYCLLKFSFSCICSACSFPITFADFGNSSFFASNHPFFSAPFHHLGSLSLLHLISPFFSHYCCVFVKMNQHTFSWFFPLPLSTRRFVWRNTNMYCDGGNLAF